MKTYKILGSESNVLTFTEVDGVYTLYAEETTGEQVELLKATDTENGFQFVEKIHREMAYCEMDYLHLFLNLIGKIDSSLYDSYIMLEPVAQI